MGTSPTTDPEALADFLADHLLPVMVPTGLPDSDDEDVFDPIAVTAEAKMKKVDSKVRKQGL